MNAIITELRTISDSVDETISSSTFPYFDQYLDATFNGGSLLPAFQQACMDDCDFPINAAFTLACRHGDLDTVKRLLRSPIDPSANNNSAFVEACDNYHIDIVSTLLKHPLVDTTQLIIINKCRDWLIAYFRLNHLGLLKVSAESEDFALMAKIISRL